MKKIDGRSKKTGIIRVKACDILKLLKTSKDDDVIRLMQIFSDYDPDDEVVIEISDKTDQEKG